MNGKQSTTDLGARLVSNMSYLGRKGGLLSLVCSATALLSRLLPMRFVFAKPFAVRVERSVGEEVEHRVAQEQSAAG